MHSKLYSSNEEFIMNMLQDSNYYMKYERPNLTPEILRAIVMGFQWFPKEKALAQLPWSPSF